MIEIDDDEDEDEMEMRQVESQLAESTRIYRKAIIVSIRADGVISVKTAEEGLIAVVLKYSEDSVVEVRLSSVARICTDPFLRAIDTTARIKLTRLLGRSMKPTRTSECKMGKTKTTCS